MSDSSSFKASDVDQSHPYYIHHSDQPGYSLVPIKLNGTNYQSWSKSVMHALIAKKKIGFINGTIEEPSQDANPEEFELWNQCNSMILSWLTHSVEADIAEGIIHARTAHQVWVDLHDQFSQKNAPAIFQIQKSIAMMSQGTMTLSAYFTKLKALWDELEAYRAPFTCNQRQIHVDQREEDKLMQLLMGLNESYKTVRSNILMMTPLPNVRQAYSLLAQEEMQRQVTSEPTENFSIAAAVQKKAAYSKSAKDKCCEHCNRPGHTIDECRTLKFHCKSCDKRGHTEDRCRLKNGSGKAAPGNQRNGRGSQSSANMADASQQDTNGHPSNPIPNFSPEQLQQIAQAISALSRPSGNSDSYINAAGLFPASQMSINSARINSWVLDSGATDHIISEASVLTESQAAIIPTVNLPNGATAHVSRTGTVLFNHDLKLDNDLATGKMIGSGRQLGGLYYISPSQAKPAAYQVSQSSDLWHLRLGHPSPSRLKLLVDHLHLNNVSSSHESSQTLAPLHNPSFYLSDPSPPSSIHPPASASISPDSPPSSPSASPSVPSPASPATSHPTIPAPPSPVSSTSSPDSPPSDPHVPLRRSARARQPPAWHSDYEMSSAANHLTYSPSQRTGTRRIRRHTIFCLIRVQINCVVSFGQYNNKHNIAHSFLQTKSTKLGV
ncbi:hypothetical protein MRB53_029043 [Persea americana]|uniref:Uncharacterized protein n=1 Tax=Persea americana TaxID=3435 RepID=A0ACC2KHB6_PERAE|nr:hypothetical protein MRB53_029043 [Persea americana]